MIIYHINIVSFLLSNILSQIIFEFEKKYPTFIQSNFNKYILENEYISTLSIGTPVQEIPLIINFKDNQFYLLHSNLKGKYNEKKSSTYKNISKITNYRFTNFNEGSIISDNIYFNSNNNNQLINNIQFILITDKKEKSSMKISQIGLTRYYIDGLHDYNFIYQLKKNKYINRFSFYFDFSNKFKLVIGTLPHELDKNKFLENDFITSHFTFEGDIFVWFITFNEIKYYNQSEINKSIFISMEFQGIYPTKEYKDFIQKNFFNEYLNNNLCFLNKDNEKFFYYICDIKIDKNKFKSIKFYHQNFNYTFILDFDDLFIKINNKYFCLILFEKNQIRYNWYVGEIFFKKYIIVFNQEKKLIGFYPNFYKEKFNIPISYYFVFLFFISTLILGYLLYKIIIKKKRRIRANELEENIDYISKENYQKLSL